MERTRIAVAVLAGALALCCMAAADKQEAPCALPVDDFQGKVTQDGLPAGWEELTFEKIERHTKYSVREWDDGDRYLHAKAERSASGLIKRMEFDITEFPVLRWRWRIDNVVQKGDARKKSGDDYAARIYINFRYDPDRAGFFTRLKYAAAKRSRGEYPPLYSINYIWANKLQKGKFQPNAYTDRAMMVAVESGNEKAGEWVEEERDVYEDFKKAFDEEPTGVIGVAIMTDTDNTGSVTSAHYDDLRFCAPEEEGEQSGDEQ